MILNQDKNSISKVIEKLSRKLDDDTVQSVIIAYIDDEGNGHNVAVGDKLLTHLALLKLCKDILGDEFDGTINR